MSEGYTPSEKYLSRLCRRSFLSLWSYTNLHTDEGRKNEKDVGDELCDVLVIFGNDVVIFSDKTVEFNRSKDINVAWKRWFKKAILKSANQIYGAESWLRQHQNRIYIDRYCQKPFPIPLPSPERIRVHRVVVAHGIYHACTEYFGRSLGSLIIHSGLEGSDHYLKPFHIGHINKKKGFVHVFEDFTLDSVLREQDTVQDFIAYLSKRKQLLSKEKPIVVAAGDEQLLAVYLTNENSEGKHDFVLPDKEGDYVYFEEGSWESMISYPVQ